jgi:hypothetical protein
MVTKFYFEKLNFGDLSVDGMIILKSILINGVRLWAGLI